MSQTRLGVGSLVRGTIAAALLGTVVLGTFAPIVTAQETDFGSLSGTIAADGSSTVGPITQAVAEEFRAAGADGVDITVDISGTGGGFKRFCAGETDVQNASRPIKDEEMAVCAENGVQYYEFEVAFDGLTVVVNKENTFLTCLNTDALQMLWQKDDPATTWADLNAEFPAETINLLGPGTDSGTFDYFVEAILGDKEIREDFLPSEDDNVLVEGVANDLNALAYFGFAYYENNQDRLNPVAIDGGNGCVLPSAETIRDGSYAPLSRPLFVYVKAESMTRPEIQGFVQFYIDNAGELATDVGFLPAPDEAYAADLEKVAAVIAGTANPDGPATPTP